MWRVLGWVVFIGGMALLGLTGVLSVFRQDESPQYLLFGRNRNAYDGQFGDNYALGVLDKAGVQPVRGAFGQLRFQGWSLNTRYLYFAREMSSGSREYQLNRFDRIAQELTPLDPLFVPFPPELVGLYWTPDGRWMVYLHQDPVTRIYSLVRRRYDGRDRLDLTTGQVADVSSSGSLMVAYSPDNHWLYFQARLQNSRNHIFRVAISGGPVEDLTPDPNNDFYVGYVPTGADWLIVLGQHNGLAGRWKMSLDGQDWQQIRDEASEIRDWIPQHDQLVVFDYQTRMLSGRRISDWAVVWEAKEAGFGGASADGKWIVLQNPGGQLIRLRPDGTDWLWLTENSYNGWKWGFAPNNEWFWFTYSETGEAPFEVRRVNMQGQLEILGSFEMLPIFTGWSPDGRWVSFNTWQTGDNELMTYQMRTDGSGFDTLVPLSPNYPFVNAFSPQIDLAWQRELLAAGGLLLIGLSLTGAYFQSRRRPAS